LGPRRFEALWEAERELTVDDAVTVALAAPWLVTPEVPAMQAIASRAATNTAGKTWKKSANSSRQ
jgi:hypothetical protein